MKTGRLNAFTVFEMVLGMLLAAIVIGMIYSAYSIFTRICINFNQSNLMRTEVKLFQRAVANDVNVAGKLIREQDRLVLRDLKDSVLLIYALQQDHIIRISTDQDTFNLSKIRFETHFEGAERNYGIIDQLTFRFLYNDMPAVFSIHKNYTSEELFNHQQ